MSIVKYIYQAYFKLRSFHHFMTSNKISLEKYKEERKNENIEKAKYAMLKSFEFNIRISNVFKKFF